MQSVTLSRGDTEESHSHKGQSSSPSAGKHSWHTACFLSEAPQRLKPVAVICSLSYSCCQETNPRCCCCFLFFFFLFFHQRSQLWRSEVWRILPRWRTRQRRRRRRSVSLIKWFSTVQQFFEKIVKCLGPLDQSDKCYPHGETLPFEWILYWESRTSLKARFCFYLFDVFTPNVWFPLLLSSPWMSLSRHSTLIVPPCVTTAVQKTVEGCKNLQAPVILFCWHTVNVFNSAPVLFFFFF